MITIWMAYLMAAVLASGVFLLAGWRSKQAHDFSAARTQHGLPHDPLWDTAATNAVQPSHHADAAAALRLALKRLAPVMTTRFVQAELAADFGIHVQMHGAALADLLEEMLGAVIHAAPASRILLTVTEYGQHVGISVTDDIPNADIEVRRSAVRRLMERVALRGGLLDVTACPDEGTTMTLRLASAADRPVCRTGSGSIKPPPMSMIPEISYDMTR